MRRVRVLLLAEACNPRFTSVPLLAFHRYSSLCRYTDVTLATQIRNRPGFAEIGRDFGNVVFIDSERVARPLHKLGKILTFGHPTALGTRSAISWLAHLYFEELVFKKFRQRLWDGDFDVVHRLTPVSPIFPSPIASRSPIPFVLGPLNGALPWPKGTRSIRWQEGEFLTPFRGLYRILPHIRQTYEHADLILTATRSVELDLPPRARDRCTRFPENGVDTEKFSARDRVPPGKLDPFTILFVGRLIPLKNPALIVESVIAAGLNKGRGIRLMFVGAGPEDTKLRALVRETGLSEVTKFVDWMPHDELPAVYRRASILALPSIHESGGAVLLEAMACGLPCVVVDYGGPAEYISDDVGLRIPLGPHEEMVKGFASAFQRLVQDRGLLDRLSVACVRAAHDRWCWDAHARRLVSLYRSLLA